MNEGGEESGGLRSSLSENEYKEIIEALREENNLLKRQLVVQSQEHSQILTTLQENVEQKDDEIEILKNNLLRIETNYHRELKTLKKSHEIQRMEKRKKIQALQKRLEEQKELEEKFNQAIQETVLLNNRIKDARSGKLEQKKEYDERLSNLQLQFSDERQHLKDELKYAQEAQKHNLHEKALDLVGEKTKEILYENQTLRIELADLQEKYNVAGQRKAIMKKKIKDFSIDNKLNQSTMKKHAQYSFRLKKELRGWKKKNEMMEETLQEKTSQFRVQLDNLRSDYEERLEEMEDVIRRKENLLRLRTTELLQLKRISERILDQRTELEKFFLEALGHVRNQQLIEKRHLQQQSRGNSSTTTGNSETKRGGRRGRNRGGGGRYLGRRKRTTTYHQDDEEQLLMEETASPSTLRKLSTPKPYESMEWQEKETVLKLLFARINGKKISIQKKKKGRRTSSRNGGEQQQQQNRRTSKGRILEDGEMKNL